jgi:8-oxo-dGTP pyrophosphatase MutT (NUDIX family)
MKVIETLRRELEPLNREIAEALRPSREALLSFVANQLYIVPHDLKALSAAMTKAKERDEYTFVKTLIDGDFAALGALRELAEELGVEFRGPRRSGLHPLPLLAGDARHRGRPRRGHDGEPPGVGPQLRRAG